MKINVKPKKLAEHHNIKSASTRISENQCIPMANDFRPTDSIENKLKSKHGSTLYPFEFDFR